MAGLVGEPDDLVLDRRAIAGAPAGQMPAIDSAFAQILGDDPVRLFRRMGDAARDLGHGDPVGQEAEGYGLGVGRLHLQSVPGDGAPIQPGGRAGLEPTQRQPCGMQIGRQTGGRRFAMAACRNAQVAPVDDAVQEGPGRQHHSAGAHGLSRLGLDADDAGAVDNQARSRPGHQGQIGGGGKLGLHGLAIEAAVDLGPRPLHRRTLGAVQHAELDSGHVSEAPHDAVQRVNLADQMALAQPADGRVAAHLADGVEPLGQQDGARARACRRRRGFTAGVPASDDDDVVRVHGRGHRGKPAAPPPRPVCFT